MVNWITAAPVVAAAFLASSVEIVEAFTIVLAVSVVRGPRPAILGAVAALAVLAVVIALAGPWLAKVPVGGLQLVVGALLLIFGLGWLRKAVLRRAGILKLHDEATAFSSETDVLRASKLDDAMAALAAFKAVLLEGTEVVFIVLAVGARPGLLVPAAVGAGAACLLVLGFGLLLRAPLTRVPENTLKFIVGGLLTGFGVFWCCEGLGAPWPGGDLAIVVLIGLYLVAGLILSGLVRREAT